MQLFTSFKNYKNVPMNFRTHFLQPPEVFPKKHFNFPELILFQYLPLSLLISTKVDAAEQYVSNRSKKSIKVDIWNGLASPYGNTPCLHFFSNFSN